jgi:hypothetical protein
MNVATQFTFSVYVSILSFEYVEMPMGTFSKVQVEKKSLDLGYEPPSLEFHFQCSTTELLLDISVIIIVFIIFKSLDRSDRKFTPTKENALSIGPDKTGIAR